MLNQVMVTRSHRVTENTEFCQGPTDTVYFVYRKKQAYVKVSQLYNNADNVSAASGVELCTSALDDCSICARPSIDQRQSTAGTACRRGKVCVQTSVGLGLQKKFLKSCGL